MMRSTSASSAPVRSGSRRSVSQVEKRQVRNWPSAVSRTRSQVEQKASVTGLMKPTSPAPSAKAKRWAVAMRSSSIGTSG